MTCNPFKPPKDDSAATISRVRPLFWWLLIGSPIVSLTVLFCFWAAGPGGRLSYVAVRVLYWGSPLIVAGFYGLLKWISPSPLVPVVTSTLYQRGPRIGWTRATLRVAKAMPAPMANSNQPAGSGTGCIPNANGENE